MNFDSIIGHTSIKKFLINSVKQSRIPHAQLFVGEEGSGMLPMAIAYAQYILCYQNGIENQTCSTKVAQLAHPDLHFVYPVTTTDAIKTKPISLDYISQWRNFIKEQPYGTLQEWYGYMGVQNKQGNISVEESNQIVKSLSLKAYEGNYKVMIIWMAEKMNTESANKILKILEEPPQKTIFLLLTEKVEDLLSTITSRCQVVTFPKVSNEIIQEHLETIGLPEATAYKYAYIAQGNIHKALQLATHTQEENLFEEWFVSWVRTAFRAKGNAQAILGLIDWAENVASNGRETQKQFLYYCIEFFRQALLQNYKAEKLVYFQEELKDFSLEKFAPFVNNANINEIFTELSAAIYHIERNGNSKIILTDLSIKLTRFIHKK